MIATSRCYEKKKEDMNLQNMLLALYEASRKVEMCVFENNDKHQNRENLMNHWRPFSDLTINLLLKQHKKLEKNKQKWQIVWKIPKKELKFMFNVKSPPRGQFLCILSKVLSLTYMPNCFSSLDPNTN